MFIWRWLTRPRGERPDPPTWYTWSVRGGTAHRADASCPILAGLARENLRCASDVETVRAHCRRACPICLGALPRPTYTHVIPEAWVWVWSCVSRIAHRPSCGRVRFIRPERLTGTNDPEEVRTACRAGCTLCRTHLDLPAAETGLVLVETIAEDGKPE